MLTFESVAERNSSFVIPPGIEATAEVPVLTGPQRQGDVTFWPVDSPSNLGERVSADGVLLVRSEASSNTHVLDRYEGNVYWQPADRSAPLGDLGVMTVADGAVAYVTHTEEHGANGFGPGSYLVQRQTEQADVIRIVAD